VLLLTIDQYEKMAEQGRLYELDSVIKQDKFDIDGILPAVLETIRSRSGGKLYGLAPGFTSQVVYYNKTMFEKNGVPLPKDMMSWEELLELAKRFPTSGDESSRIYGLALNNYSDNVFVYARMIGDTKGLSFVDAESSKVTIQTDGWKKAAQLAIDALKSGTIYRPSPDKQFRGGPIEEYYKSDPFIGGKAAMMISGSYLMDNLKQAKSYLKDQAPDWDVVTLPVDPQNPDAATGMSIYQLFAVNAQSANLRAAWEFVKYVNDNEYARVTSKSSSFGTLTSRTQYLKDAVGHNIAAFSKLKGSGTTSAASALAKLPNSFYQAFITLADKELKAALDGSKSVDEAIQTIQDRGQAELIKAKQAEEEKGMK